MQKLLTLIVAFGLQPAFADEEAGNYPVVFADEYGRCYVKSLPKHISDPYLDPTTDKRQEGQTKVYLTGDPDDKLITTYDWYSSKIFVDCHHIKDNKTGIAIVRRGPWHRGPDPRPEHLAIAFYFNGKLSKSYSTLDIAGNEKHLPGARRELFKNVEISISHYRVFKTVHAKMTNVYNMVIVAKTVDGRTLTFDPGTGEILSTQMPD